MNHFFLHIRQNIFRGLLAMIPISLSLLALFFLSQQIDRRVMVFLDQYYDFKHIPGFGIAVLLFFLLFIGIVVSHLVGRNILKGVDAVFMSLPVIKQIYSLAKLMSNKVSLDDNHEVLKKTLLINYPNANQWTIAFLTGRVKREEDKDLLTVFVPYAHPVFGFVFLVEESKVIDPGWPVDQGLKMIVTLGLVAPTQEQVKISLQKAV